MQSTAQATTNRNGERIQTVLFLRHGVAKHNLPDPRTGQPPDLRNPKLLDPPLVSHGMKQALAVRERLADGAFQKVQLVIASPLTRCLQTAHLVLFPAAAENAYQKDPIPMICLEQVREAYGMHYPDKRRDKSLLQKHWPFVQFDPTMTEKDVQWSATYRETLDDVVTRVTHFFSCIVQREETHILTVSHGVWIEACLQAYFPLMLQGGRRVYNCDCFEAELVSHNGRFVRLQNVGKI